MVKVIELIVVLALLIFSFFAGVKYSDSVRERAGWLFESKEEEVELPDLSSENPADAAASMDENGVNLENPSAAAAAAPMDSIDNTAPAAQPAAAPAAQPAAAAPAPAAAPAAPATRSAPAAR